MKPWTLIVIGLLVCLDRANGNGGIFTTSSIRGTGHLVPQKKNRIALESETLRVSLPVAFDGLNATKPRGELTRVEVDYQLANHGGADTVTYGFPIDSLGTAWDEQGVSFYRIKANEDNLAIRKIIHEPAEDSITEVNGKTVRDWYFSEIAFARGERKAVHIEYQMKTLGQISGTSKSFRWFRSENTFRYTFSPAQTWGNGRLPKLRIEVDVRELRGKKVPITVVSPPGSVERDGMLIWDLQDVDLRKIPDLVIRYNLGPAEMEKDIRPRRLDRRMIESIRASSTLPRKSQTRYGIENVLDGRSDTAWIEGAKGSGVGEWIEITFKPGTMIKGIGVLNGYAKSPAALEENGYVKEMNARCTPRMNGEAQAPEETKLPRPNAAHALPDWPISALDWVVDLGEGANEIRKVKLTIRDAALGKSFADTAISEIFIYGWKKGDR